jgi:hypothetical protein
LKKEKNIIFTCGLITLVGFWSSSNSGSFGFSTSFSVSLESASFVSLTAAALSSCSK